MSILQMVQRVLEEEKRALYTWEIWQVAKDKGYDKLIESWENTASASLKEFILADVRGNPSSIFVPFGEGPTRFILKKQLDNLRSGKKVLIVENVHYVLDEFTNILEVIATKGSIGTILSYREYIAHADESPKRSGYSIPQHHREWVHSGMKAKTHFPVKFNEVVPLSDDDYVTLKEQYESVLVSCQTGALMILPIESFTAI